jgi:hypothetical protein
MAPKDEDELVDMMFTASHERHPTFIRYPRGPGEGVPVKDQPRLLEVGKAEIVQSFRNNGGRKVALFPLGNMMRLGHQTAGQLESEGYDVAMAGRISSSSTPATLRISAKNTGSRSKTPSAKSEPSFLTHPLCAKASWPETTSKMLSLFAYSAYFAVHFSSFK